MAILMQHRFGIADRSLIGKQRLALVSLAQQIGSESQSHSHFATTRRTTQHQCVGNTLVLRHVAKAMDNFLLADDC